MNRCRRGNGYATKADRCYDEQGAMNKGSGPFGVCARLGQGAGRNGAGNNRRGMPPAANAACSDTNLSPQPAPGAGRRQRNGFGRGQCLRGNAQASIRGRGAIRSGGIAKDGTADEPQQDEPCA